MKKLALLLSLALLVLSLASCGVLNGEPINNTPAHTHTPATLSSVDPTCAETGLTEGKKCSTCYEIIVKQETIPALGHTTDTGVCSRCNEDFGTWELRNYVDEFDNPTGENFISTTVYGVFSNSATTNSSLTATVQVDTDDVSIILYEYSRNMVKCSYKYDEYSIIMLDTNNQKYYLSGTMYAGGFRIYLDDEDKTTVVNALKKSGEISFHVVYTEYTTSTYTFTIQTSNFSTLYKTLN